ncbi:DUF2075 domain-containing protein [Amycolatopsis cihanbeyliensis]|uniref:AAA+ ATPase domain-containing protein n=1 Tax=Amycolatopsis cihanbeyliensis TaxID=1128664 RepID=A0A542DLX3_AMYCI|nr:DUF2075 domain-containing protein [Amycolatopsis cihanbeyliensis]TQJ04087.1 hypothetical protein FB471_3868 [Amycolatopsis cihanbeyliensis]
MALVRQSAEDLLIEARAERLHLRLQEQARFALEHRAGTGEVNSWKRSLLVFLTDLVDAGLGHVEVLLEHQLPHSPKRVDAVLCGTHPRSDGGEPSYVLVELKQWSAAEMVAADVVRVDYYADPVLHPAEQVRSYCEYLVDSTPALAESPHAVHGVAYLHNARTSGVATLGQYRPSDLGQLFTADDKADLLKHLRSLLDVRGERDAARKAADDFLSFRHGPTKPLLDLAAKEIEEREQFVLLDEQRVAFQVVNQAVRRARAARTQTVVVVLGGPGSGKSVIALSLMGSLSRQGREVHHATGSRAFTNTMRQISSRREKRLKNLFKFFNNYTTSEQRGLDVLLCDEAHRIRETSVTRFTGREQRARARPQVNELIDAAWVPVFLLDENQTVKPGEMGSLAEIREAAHALGCQVEVVPLEGQFRCGGSATFDDWVARLLGLDRRPPAPWSELASPLDEEFTVSSAASPQALEHWLLEKQRQHEGTARVAAGFCWRWSNPVETPEGMALVRDVQIGDWQRPWNAKPGKRVPEAPESHYWASDERGFHQVGCIYTAQGFEYDWAGVIFGPDLVRRGDRWVPRREYSHDTDVKKAGELHFGALIRNTYKVLLTRGMRGVCVHSTDPETQEFLDSMVR